MGDEISVAAVSVGDLSTTASTAGGLCALEEISESSDSEFELLQSADTAADAVTESGGQTLSSRYVGMKNGRPESMPSFNARTICVKTASCKEGKPGPAKGSTRLVIMWLRAIIGQVHNGIPKPP